MRIARQEALGGGGGVGEVATTAAGNEDFGAWFKGVVEQQHAAAPLAGGDGAHQPGGAGAEDDDVEVADGVEHGGLMKRVTPTCIMVNRELLKKIETAPWPMTGRS